MTTNTLARSLRIFICLALALSIPFSLAASPRVSTQTGGSVQEPDIRVITSIGLKYELPKGWKAENQEDGNVFLSFENGTCNVTFVVDEDYAGVAEGMKSSLKEQLAEMKLESAAKEDTHNGMKHIGENGSGMMKAVKVIWSIDVLLASKNVTILTFGVEEVMQKHGDEYAKFISSLKKTN